MIKGPYSKVGESKGFGFLPIGNLVHCKKCKSTEKTLRKIITKGEKEYYCESCIKKAIRRNEDVRKD